MEEKIKIDHDQESPSSRKPLPLVHNGDDDDKRANDDDHHHGTSSNTSRVVVVHEGSSLKNNNGTKNNTTLGRSGSRAGSNNPTNKATVWTSTNEGDNDIADELDNYRQGETPALIVATPLINDDEEANIGSGQTNKEVDHLERKIQEEVESRILRNQIIAVVAEPLDEDARKVDRKLFGLTLNRKIWCYLLVAVVSLVIAAVVAGVVITKNQGTSYVLKSFRLTKREFIPCLYHFHPRCCNRWITLIERRKTRKVTTKSPTTDLSI